MHVCWFLLKRMYPEEADYGDSMTHIPKLPTFTKLNIKIDDTGWRNGHRVGAKLIAKCTEIEELSIQTPGLVRLHDLYVTVTPLLQ
jgi:hypothetical protein